MPKRTDIQKILLIGSGPIVIGQACEFDYSGTQACRALRAEGYEVILVNSNPATIMTDPDTADKSYIEPLTTERLEKIIERERPEALLPTLGGQTALNLALALEQEGILEKYQIEMLGADKATIERAENREQFATIVESLGLEMCKAHKANTMEEAWAIQAQIGFPCLIRASFTLGGEGSGVAKTAKEFEKIAQTGLKASRITEIMIEPQLDGWKEFELEMMSDQNQNVVVICGIENLDPLGIHTGDSITVAPIQTLSNRQYQKMRDASIALMQAVGVRTGGANIQYAVCPQTGKMLVIEMNPRVSRSSALASKATGYPIAKFAAKLAVGYTLDELVNDITQKTACFEPSLDYCVVKFPRFNLDKFEGNYPLGTSMRAIGEVMAIGANFKAAFSKGLRALEEKTTATYSKIEQLEQADPKRIYYLLDALKQGVSLELIHQKSKIDPWFLHQLQELVQVEIPVPLQYPSLLKAKQWGLSDKEIAQKTGLSAKSIYQHRKEWNIQPTYKLVDSCSAEFEAFTPYYYSTFEMEDESPTDDTPKVMIIGSGANRIGQGIEFDYSCVQAAQCLSKMGYTSIMVNSNPETVSTDYDISDKLYFEPLSFEEVYAIYEKERPEGLILQLGGQTPFQLLDELVAAGVPILGTSAASIELAEDRDQFSQLLSQLNIQQSLHASANNASEVYANTEKIGLPLLLRPSFVIGGTQMKVVHDAKTLHDYVNAATEYPLQLDQFLENAIELDVDLIADGKEVVICGIMEQVQTAGVHSGDSAAVWPAYSLSEQEIAATKKLAHELALALDIRGFLNIQLAWKDGQLYVLEANPRASRTIPFLCKAQGCNWVEVATAVMLGKPLAALSWSTPNRALFAVKEVVFPFAKFEQSPIQFDVQMRSTGEVMGQDQTVSLAYYKAKLAAGRPIPLNGKVYVHNVNSKTTQHLQKLGFELTSDVKKADWLISLEPKAVSSEGLALRRTAWQSGILISTDERELDLCMTAIQELRKSPLGLYPLQERIFELVE